MPKLNVIGGTCSRFQANRLADDESDGFRLCFPYLLRGQRATFTAVQELMTDLVHERAELLSRLHLGKQSDPAALGDALGGRNVLGIVERDSLCLDELH